MTASPHPIPARALRRATVLLVPVVAAAVLVLGLPSSALAHDGLVSTSPADGTAAGAPAAVELVFTGEPLPIGTLVAVTGPDGAVSDGDAEIRGTAVVQRLTGDLPAGDYRVDWRSTSSDGHALTGTFGFTVAAGTAASGGPAGVPTPAVDARSSETSAGPVAPVWLVVGAVVLAGLGALVVTRVRRRA